MQAFLYKANDLSQTPVVVFSPAGCILCTSVFYEILAGTSAFTQLGERETKKRSET
jgi:hypothetical protein